MMSSSLGGLIIGIIIGFLIAALLDFLASKTHWSIHIKGRRVHHSLLGAAFLLIALAGNLSFKTFLLAGSGLGIIIHHTRKEGLKFFCSD